jgi:DNA-binding NtrC family response regulator
LFGHERGAFTGAAGQRIGAFEEAATGTLFLDEVGELPTDLQPKLLRALEKREIRRVGSNRMKLVDVRVVCATNRDLRTDVNAGRFRADLYYRLGVVRVQLPPLRGRLEDVPLLVEAILRRLSADETMRALLTAPDFLAALARAAWPGNVRELRNFLQRCLVFRQALPVSEVGPGIAAQPIDMWNYADARKRALDDFERHYLEALLARHDGRVVLAAQEAGVARAHIYKLLKKHGLLARLRTRLEE